MNKTFEISVEMRGLSKILIQSKLLAEDQNKINNLTETEREARWSHFYWLFFAQEGQRILYLQLGRLRRLTFAKILCCLQHHMG